MNSFVWTSVASAREGLVSAFESPEPFRQRVDSIDKVGSQRGWPTPDWQMSSDFVSARCDVGSGKVTPFRLTAYFAVAAVVIISKTCVRPP